jgi:hypothetical protein
MKIFWILHSIKFTRIFLFSRWSFVLNSLTIWTISKDLKMSRLILLIYFLVSWRLLQALLKLLTFSLQLQKLTFQACSSTDCCFAWSSNQNIPFDIIFYGSHDMLFHANIFGDIILFAYLIIPWFTTLEVSLSYNGLIPRTNLLPSRENSNCRRRKKKRKRG